MFIQPLFTLLVLLTVTLNTVAQTFLKLGATQGSINFYLLSGLFAYGLSTVFYVLVLGKYNLSIAYPMVIGLTVIAATFSGTLILKEQVSMVQWTGIGLMLSGIFAITVTKVS